MISQVSNLHKMYNTVSDIYNHSSVSDRNISL